VKGDSFSLLFSLEVARHCAKEHVVSEVPSLVFFVLNYSWPSTCAVIDMLDEDAEIIYRKL